MQNITKSVQSGPLKEIYGFFMLEFISGRQICIFVQKMLESDNVRWISVLNTKDRVKKIKINIYATFENGQNLIPDLIQKMGAELGIRIEQVCFDEVKEMPEVGAWDDGTKRIVFRGIGIRKLAFAPEDILYFERIRRVTVVGTVWGNYKIWNRLSEIEDVLDGREFVRCHNSYIIRLSAVREYCKNRVTLRDGTSVTISRKYWQEVRERFESWCEEKFHPDGVQAEEQNMTK